MSIFLILNWFMVLESLKKWGKDSANLFVINIFIVYAAWKVFAYYVKNSYGFIHHTWLKLIVSMGMAYATVTSFILNMFSEKTTHVCIAVVYTDIVKIIRVEDHCLAIPATIIFVGTILLFKGSWKDKLWFIPMGVLLICMINVIRLVILCYIFAHYTRQFFDINHSLVYVVVTYALIFLMIVWWMKKFVPQNK